MTFQRPRLGHIAFLDCLPLYWGLGRTGGLVGVELRQDTPDRLNQALVNGELDISPISLAEYLRHADQLVLLPDLAIGSDGPVLSVNLISHQPVEELTGARIALGSTSRTGVLLAQVLLEQRYGVHAEYVQRPPVWDVMLQDTDAAVLIGDAALSARFEATARGLRVVDLAEEWRVWTGLPMVFAVWAARKDFAAAHPDLTRRIHRRLLHARNMSLTEVDEMAAAAAEWEPFDAQTLAWYFRVLDFSLGDRQLSGLRRFAQLAAETGLVPPLAAEEPRFIAPFPVTMQV